MTEILTPDRAAELLAAPDTVTEAKALVPASPMQDSLAAYAVGETKEKLVCANLLTPEERVRAQAEAQTILPELIGNINFLMVYATDVVDGLNKLIRDAFGKDKANAEIDAMLDGLQDEFAGLGGKYDISRPEVRKKFEQHKKRVLGFLWQARTMFQMLIQDSQSLVKRMDTLQAQVEAEAEEAMSDARLFKKLYEQNEELIRTLVYKIAVLEYARSLVLTEFESTDGMDATDPANRDLFERRNVLGKVLGSLNIRIGDFQSRLLDAYGASPEFSDWVQANFDLALKLDFLAKVGFPAILQALLTWQKNASSVAKAKTITRTNSFYNDVKQQSARAGAAGVTEVANAAQQQVLLGETMAVILQSAQDRAQGVRDAAKAGSDARLKFAEQAMETIHGLQTTQADLQQDLADQAAAEAAALRAAMEAQQATSQLILES